MTEPTVPSDERPLSEAMTYRQQYAGLIGVASKVRISDTNVLSTVYTPGVAQPCLDIEKHPGESFAQSMRGNTVAIVSDGSSAFGLGMVGPEAILPVMEGKSVIFKTFAGVDALPICLSTHDISEIVETVIELAPTFGGICLEDIVAPACLTIGEELQRAMNIPVINNHREAVAVGVLAGVLNALRVVDKLPEDVKVVINGAGAAGIGTAELLLKAGVRDIIVCDRHGALSPYRPQTMHWAKWELAKKTNPHRVRGDLATVIRGADLFIGFSVGDVVTPEMVRSMAPRPIIFAFAGPVPEIEPAAARAAGAAVVATAQSQYPNQMDIASVFPGLFSRAPRCPRARRQRSDASRRRGCARGPGPARHAHARVHHSEGARLSRRTGDCAGRRRRGDCDRDREGRCRSARGSPSGPCTSFAPGDLPVAPPTVDSTAHRLPRSLSTCTGDSRAYSRSRARFRSPATTFSASSTCRLAPSNRWHASPNIRNGSTTTRSSGTSSQSSPTRSAVLGLGNIGARAAMPVMEGKSVLFHTFGGVEAFPICLATQDPDEIVAIVKRLEPTFGGVNLEDISAPRCFYIEDRLRKETNIPIFHDDQHGTAVVVLAGVMNACKITGRALKDVSIVVNGAGASAIAVSKLLISVGVGDVILCDTSGAIYQGRPTGMNWIKEEMAAITNSGNLVGNLADAMRGRDLFIGLSAAGAATPAMVSSMNQQAIVFALANPVPEIFPDDAKRAGAAVCATWPPATCRTR